MLERYMGGFRAKDKGNIFCASRIRAPAVALAFDLLSFPFLLAAAGPDAAFSDAYVNVKPFCTPWPACVDPDYHADPARRPVQRTG